MKVFYATTNKGKMLSLQRDLQEYNIEVRIPQNKLALYEIQSLDVQEISKDKAKQAYNLLKEPVICQDSGFCIDSLGNWPSADVKNILDNKKMGVSSILKLLEREENRTARFDQSLAYFDNRMPEAISFIEHVEGSISYEERGKIQPHHWSELTKIFIPQGKDVTLAEMTEEEYMEWRKAARKEVAAKKLGSWLLENRIKNIRIKL